MNNNQSWQCPYCGHHQVLSETGNLKYTTTDIVQIIKCMASD